MSSGGPDVTATPVEGTAVGASAPLPHLFEAEAVAATLGVDVGRGLSAEQVQLRLQQYGPNQLTGAKKESGFQAFLRQYEDFMQIVLLAAAVINQIVTGDTGTTVVLAGLTLFNAVMGLHQEGESRGERQGTRPDDEDGRPCSA